jgi:hypothetical protein
MFAVLASSANLVTFQSARNLDGNVAISYLYRGLAQYLECSC